MIAGLKNYSGCLNKVIRSLIFDLNFMTANDVLDKAAAEVSIARAEIGILLGALTHEQLLWRPAPDKWNIALVAQHLINNNQPYFGAIRGKISKYKGEANNDKVFKHTFWGKFLYKTVTPETITKKLKTPKPFRPEPDPDITTLADRFDANQQELLAVIEESRRVDSQKVFVRSPAAWMMRFHIADALAALSVHELRHLKQVRAIMANEGFPKM